MHARTPRIAVLGLGLLMILAACSIGGPGSSTTPDGELDPSALEGRTFLSTRVDGAQLVDGSQIRLTFQGGSLGLSAGCNSMSGAYRIDGDTLVVQQMGGTDMACEEPLMAQDTWVAGFLREVGIALDGHTLTLSRGDVTITLVDREVADPDRELIGTRWVLDGIIDGEAVSSVPLGVSAALTFADGQVSVEAGCNQGGAEVEIDDGTLVIGPLGLTKKACDAPAAAVEAAIVAALDGTVTYTIEADVLTIRAANAGLVLRAAP